MSGEGWHVTGAEQMVRTLWLEGLSASQIAKQLTTIGVRVSRNAVIGKVHRLGLAGRASPSRPTKRAARPVKTIALPAKRSAPAIVKDERHSSRKPPAKSDTSTRFADLQPGQCKMFCSGEEGAHGYCCGAPALGSWCSRCWQIVKAPEQKVRAA